MTVKDVDSDSWKEEVLSGGDLTVVEFWHDACPWCKRLNPIYDALSEEYEGKAKLVRFNVLDSERNKRLAVNSGIMSTPTLVFYCTGRSVGSIIGFQPEQRLRQVIDDMLARHKECIEKSSSLEEYV